MLFLNFRVNTKVFGLSKLFHVHLKKIETRVFNKI